MKHKMLESDSLLELSMIYHETTFSILDSTYGTLNMEPTKKSYVPLRSTKNRVVGGRYLVLGSLDQSIIITLRIP